MSENQTVDKVCNKSCGIDFGTSVIAVAVSFSDNPLRSQLVSNLLANETTPGVVKLYRDAVTIGEDAVATATICPQNVFSHIPLILEYTDKIDEMKEKYPDLCFSIHEGKDKQLYFDVVDDSMITEISLTQVVALLFEYVRKIVSVQYPENLNSTVVSLPSTVPASSTRILLDAAHLAGFDDVQFVSTTTAQAYHYSLRLKSTMTDAEGSQSILFVDQGSCFTSLYVVRVSSTECSLVYSTESQLGAKDVDRYLYDYFVAKLKGKVDIRPYSKQAIRLMNGCCRLKKMLSAASKAVYTVDGLLDGNDYQLELTRAQFEDIIRPQIEAFEKMVTKVKEEFTESIDAVEMIGGGSRMVFMQTIVQKVIGLPLRFTVDSASCIAKGCALLGMYSDVQSMMAMKEPIFLPIPEGNKERYEAIKEKSQQLSERTAKQEAKSEMINRFESLIAQMRREMEGEFGNQLDKTLLEPLLDTESSWLMEAEEAEIEVITERFNQFDTRLKTTFKDFFDAKEKKHLEIEKQLEEESKKRVEKDDKEDVKLPYKTRLSRVEVNKKEGNDLFKDKNYAMAVQRYMRALGHTTKFFDLSPEQKEVVADLEKSLRLNLAQCFIKLEGWEKAIEHCTNVLKKDPQNTKALYRRAFCYDKLKDIEKCTEDLNVVMKLIPDDPSVKNLHNRNEVNRKRLQEKRKAMARRMFGSS